MATIETSLTRLLGIEHPVLLAPMGSAAGGRLAAAVTNAGGLGLIGSGYADVSAIDRELSAAGNARVGIGLVTWALDRQPHVLESAIARRPAAIMLSFGDPLPYVKSIKAAEIPLICQVQTLYAARAAAQAGADIIIAQGRDAGGHSGMTRGTIGFVPAVADAVHPIPVVAAGGISDGRGLAAALALGASGVLMGTRFATSRESLWSDAMKQRLIEAGGDDTQQTRVFDIVRDLPWPAQFPGRAVRNAFMERWHDDEDGLRADRSGIASKYLSTPETDFSSRVVWAGEGADLIDDVPSAKAIIDEMIVEAINATSRTEKMAQHT